MAIYPRKEGGECDWCVSSLQIITPRREDLGPSAWEIRQTELETVYETWREKE